MKRHLIYGRYGINDKDIIDVNVDEAATEFQLLSSSNTFRYGIGKSLADLAKLNAYPSSIGLDLMVLAAHVQIADTRISRDTESQDSWTREIRVVVPVEDLELWRGVAPVLKRALDFLTGDLWTIEFRQKIKDSQALIPNGLNLQKPVFDEVSLFSGGMDSLIGAIDKLESGKTPLLVSHAGDSITSVPQDNCFNTLKAHYNANKFERLRLWMDVSDVKVGGGGSEKTTRGRSFLFFAAGVFAGTGLDGRFTLNVPENGLIALNVPLDSLRLGSHSTHTTHPFYIARWNEMLEGLGIPGKIENPYWDKTKGEMAAECQNKPLLHSLIPASLSCSSAVKATRQHLPPQHCGYCLPCLIRRAAVAKGFGHDTDKTVYTEKDLTKQVLDSSMAIGQQVRSFQFAIERLRKRPGLANILIHSAVSLSDESAERQKSLAEVYRRGLAEVDDILKNVRTRAK